MAAAVAGTGLSLPFCAAAFLPGDDVDDGVSGRCAATQERWVIAASRALGKLLAESGSLFARHVSADADLHRLFDSYLAHRQRPHDADCFCDAAVAGLDRRVLLVCARWARDASCRPKAGKFLNTSRCFALAAIFGPSQPALVAAILQAALRDGDVSEAELRKAAQLGAQALRDVADAAAKDAPASTAGLAPDEAVAYALDAAVCCAEVVAASAPLGRALLRALDESDAPALPLSLARLGDAAAFSAARPAIERAVCALVSLLASDAAAGDARAAAGLAAYLVHAAKGDAAESVALTALGADARRDAANALAASQPTLDAATVAYARAVLGDAAPAPAPAPRRAAPPRQPEAAAASLESWLEELVASVQAILPADAFGDGFVAACLIALSFDVGVVASRLLDGDVPAQVRHVDRDLARVGVAASQTRRARPADKQNEADFRDKQRARVRALESAVLETQRLRELAAYDDDCESFCEPFSV
ncbi:hypothetical protein M885DRAFT_207781 [Pelagophyceae sp. CCMP2097]|nr:hypothetical protein M885DRAFT_207781 [Pelagophyceae sp. CCMP2097]